MVSLTQPLNGHSAATDDASRIKLQDTLRGAAEELETPHDLMLRLVNSSLEVAVIRAGCDLGIFKRLAKCAVPQSVEQLADACGADALLLGRLLRYLASVRMITETGRDQFTGNNATKTLTDPRIQGSIYYIFNIGGPAYQALPDFLQETKYQNNTAGKCAWQKSVGTELPFFPWVKQHPEKLTWFQQLMSVPREGEWLDVVPIAEAAVPVQPGEPFFVDIGGSIGHQCARLRAKYPDLAGRVIVQDLPETVKVAPRIEGVEFMVHDFFNPQPIKGARFYYLRTVLHDWEDDKAAEILKNIIPAMTADSRILIDDMALPNTGVHWWSACLDLHMLTMLGALERNVDQWHALLERAGLRLIGIKTYHPLMRHSVMVAALR